MGVEEWTTVLVEELITINVDDCIECVDYPRYVSQKRQDQTYHKLCLHISFWHFTNIYNQVSSKLERREIERVR